MINIRERMFINSTPHTSPMVKIKTIINGKDYYINGGIELDSKFNQYLKQFDNNFNLIINNDELSKLYFKLQRLIYDNFSFTRSILDNISFIYNSRYLMYNSAFVELFYILKDDWNITNILSVPNNNSLEILDFLIEKHLPLREVSLFNDEFIDNTIFPHYPVYIKSVLEDYTFEISDPVIKTFDKKDIKNINEIIEELAESVKNKDKIILDDPF